LSCPSCRTALIVDTAGKERILGIQEKLQREALPDAELLYITGSGDPFGSPFFREWLQTMRRADMPRLETIRLHSNGLLWNEKMWHSIDADVRSLVREAEISIDAATAETYAVNRRGGSFARLLRNLDYIATLRANGPLRWLGISMVVQENNFGEMPAFIDLGRRIGADTVYFGQLVDWGTFPEEELRRRSIHLAEHPRHGELRSVLRSPHFDDPRVDLGNLSHLRLPASCA
jgi:MoaA/NifB/PqqE/SkfB family radical SAM enzyme